MVSVTVPPAVRVITPLLLLVFTLLMSKSWTPRFARRAAVAAAAYSDDDALRPVVRAQLVVGGGVVLVAHVAEELIDLVGVDLELAPVQGVAADAAGGEQHEHHGQDDEQDLPAVTATRRRGAVAVAVAGRTVGVGRSGLLGTAGSVASGLAVSGLALPVARLTLPVAAGWP